MCNEREPDYYRAVKDVDGVFLVRDALHNQVGPTFYVEQHAIDAAGGMNWAHRLLRWEVERKKLEPVKYDKVAGDHYDCRDLGKSQTGF